MVECLGCKIGHYIPVVGKVKWQFSGDTENPTFSPSLLVNSDLKAVDIREYVDPVDKEIKQHISHRCHSFIRNGQWQYLKDCTHELAGKTVDMVDVE